MSCINIFITVNVYVFDRQEFHYLVESRLTYRWAYYGNNCMLFFHFLIHSLLLIRLFGHGTLFLYFFFFEGIFQTPGILHSWDRVSFLFKDFDICITLNFDLLCEMAKISSKPFDAMQCRISKSFLYKTIKNKLFQEFKLLD